MAKTTLFNNFLPSKTTLSKRTPSDPVASMPERAKGCFLSLF